MYQEGECAARGVCGCALISIHDDAQIFGAYVAIQIEIKTRVARGQIEKEDADVGNRVFPIAIKIGGRPLFYHLHR